MCLPSIAPAYILLFLSDLPFSQTAQPQQLTLVLDSLAEWLRRLTVSNPAHSNPLHD